MSGRLLLSILGWLLVAPAFGSEPRRVFVLHSGLHTLISYPEKNIAAEQLRDGLKARGVPARDLVVLDNPFPTASWRQWLPWEAVTLFVDSMVPDSQASHGHYLRMHKALAERGVKDTDHVVWIGHSAGGTIGMTMAHLACRLDDHPDLAKAAKGYHFDTVITLGAPLGEKPPPAIVKFRPYFSPKDTTVHFSAQYGTLALFPFGYRVAIRGFPDRPQGNTMGRFFPGVQHNHWNTDPRVLDCILGEFQQGHRPAWQAPPPLPNPGLSLAQLLARAVAHECHCSLQDLPSGKD